MTKNYIHFFPILLIILMGCPMGLETSEPSATAKKALNKYGAERIINDGKIMLEQVPSNGPVSSSKWPESIAAFKPKMVVSGSDRIRLILKKRGRYENGVIIYTTIPEYIQKYYDQGNTILSAGSGYGEFKMARGISWYYQKGRY
jgi:hypothetical protein